MTTPTKYLVEVSYPSNSVEEERYVQPVAVFSDEEVAEETARKYRELYSPDESGTPIIGNFDHSDIRVDVIPIPNERAYALPSRIYIGFYPKTSYPAGIFSDKGHRVVSVYYETATGFEITTFTRHDQLMPKAALVREAIGKPGEVLTYEGIYFRLRGGNPVKHTVSMAISTDRKALDNHLAICDMVNSTMEEK